MKFSKLILKNILRNKRRTLLTISSLVVSLFLIITLATILTEFTQGHEASNPLRLITRHAVSLGFTLPVAQQQRIATVPGVKSVIPFSWFGGIYKDEKNFFANFAVDARKFREVMTELKMSEDQWQAFINDRQGAIVGQKLVTLYGFSLGQRITLRSPIYDRSVEFIVRGICTGGDEKTLFFHHDYINAGQEVLNILATLNRELKKTIIMVTHDPHAASFATHERHLEKGVLLDGASAVST